MKLRIHGNSVRLRLGRSEVGRLLEVGRLQEHTAFGPAPEQRLWYMIELSMDQPTLSASLEGSTVRVTVPAHQARHWASTDTVGIDAELDIGGGLTNETLHLLIEKDFQCLHHDAPSAPEEADAFPNPAASARQG